MKDSELRAIVLEQFYQDRRGGARIWNELDVPEGVSPSDFFAVCGQLAEHRLIEWQQHGKNGERGGRGKIIAAGIDVVEEPAKSPIEIKFDHSQTVTIHGSNNIVGNNNQLSLERVNSEIFRSNFSEAEKAEAKSLWQKVCENKLLNTVVGSVFGAATKHALETNQPK